MKSHRVENNVCDHAVLSVTLQVRHQIYPCRLKSIQSLPIGDQAQLFFRILSCWRTIGRLLARGAKAPMQSSHRQGSSQGWIYLRICNVDVCTMYVLWSQTTTINPINTGRKDQESVGTKKSFNADSTQWSQLVRFELLIKKTGYYVNRYHWRRPSKQLLPSFKYHSQKGLFQLRYPTIPIVANINV